MNFFKRLFSLTLTGISQQIQSPAETGNRVIVTFLNSLDGRRLRGQSGDNFRVTLWHASQRRQIFAYGIGDDTYSTLPIGIIPNKYYNIILPFLDYEDETVSYKAKFDKNNNQLTIELSYRALEDIQEERRKQQIESEESDRRLHSEHVAKLIRPYELKKDLKQRYYIGTSTKLKGIRKLGNLSIELLEKKDYMSDRKFNKVNFLEDGKILGTFNADLRVIRALFSGQKMVINSHEIERERSFGETYTTVYFTVSSGN